MTDENNLQSNVPKSKTKIFVVAIVAMFFCLIAGGVYAWQNKTKSASTANNVFNVPSEQLPATVQVYEAYDCDKLRAKNIEISDGETPLSTALKFLPGPGGLSTVAKYAKSFKIEGNIAHIDWPNEMASLSNIDTSCALQSFLLPIEKTLTQISPIEKVIHSMGGSVSAFYQRMQLACPQESPECDYDTVSISIDKEFKITNIGNSSKLGDPATTIFPIFAYQCDIYEVRDNVPLRYSKIDFFISKDEKNSPTIFLGTTPGGSAGSGECDLQENENGLRSKLTAGKYRIWAVRYIDNKPDAQTADVYITIKNSISPRQ